jgi:hypothetical protein
VEGDFALYVWGDAAGGYYHQELTRGSYIVSLIFDISMDLTGVTAHLRRQNNLKIEVLRCAVELKKLMQLVIEFENGSVTVVVLMLREFATHRRVWTVKTTCWWER